jgi:hypothetical protein
MLVPKIIALENPWNIRRIISEMMLWENRIRKVDMVNSKIPRVKIFFLPIISPSRPNGIRKIADVKIKLLITQPRLIALACSSLPIEGRARFSADVRKGTRKAAKVETRSTAFLKLFSSDIPASIVIVYYQSNNLSSFQPSIIPLFQIIPSL